MKVHRSSFRLLACSIFTLVASATALAQKPALEPNLVMQEVESGHGWTRMAVTDANILSKGGTPPLADLLVVSPDGIEDLPIAQIHKDELYEDFGLAGGKGMAGEEASTELVVIDYQALDQIETGIWRPEYLALAEPDEPTPLGGEQSASFGCSGWKDRDKTKTWNVNNSLISQNFPLGGGFTGSYNVQLPLLTTGTAKFNYQIKKNFLCIPYKFRVKNIQATGQAALAGSAQLQASASLAFKWENDWQIANPDLGRVTFWVGFIPVWIDFSLPINAGLKLDAKVTATVAQSFDLGSAGSFSYTCTSSSCTGGSDFQDSFHTSGLSASLQGEIEAEANAKVQIRADVWKLFGSSVLHAQAGVKGFVKAKVWGYYGNNCGDGDGDGQNETVRALLADANAGFDIIYSVGGVVPSHNGSINGGRYNLGWWDLLGAGGSTVLSPMIAGPASAQPGESVSYVVKMRPCYPYSKAVDLEMGPGTWSGTLRIAKPKGVIAAENSTTLTRSFPAAGPQTIVATALRDADHTLSASTSRILQVQAPQQISPSHGLWYNPARSGNGIEFLTNMWGDHVVLWYTYEGSEPVWYISDVAQMQNNSWSAPLYRSVWNGASNSISVVGSVGLDFSSESSATFNWQLYGQSGSEPYELLFSGGGRSGSWYPPAESGWGMSIAEDGSFAALYVQYYDGAGQPTWALGNTGPGVNLFATMERHHASGLCPGCTGPIQRWTEVIGNVRVDSSPYGYLFVSTELPGWHRTNAQFYQLATH